MTRPEHDPLCEEMLDLLEPYLDGDLPIPEAARLREHLTRCTACTAEMALAAKIQRELRSLRQPGGDVVPFRPRHRATGLRVAAAAAVLALAIGGGAVFLHLQGQREQPSPEEIARATAEARFALAYVGKVTRTAGLDLRDEVLEKRLIVPATRSVSRSLGGNPAPAAVTSPAGRPEKEF
jgi:anti-sigma factor RsiW